MNDKHRMLIEALAGTPRDLTRLTRRVTEIQALVRPAPDAWCIKDVIAHLLDIEPHFRARFERMLAEDNPREPALVPDPAAHDLARPAPDLIAGFAAERARTTALLAALTHQQWLRTCQHEAFGPTRLRKQVEILIGHDNEHLAQIVNLREYLDQHEEEKRPQ
jgi:uncharacterized damage-inducible protein DinB